MKKQHWSPCIGFVPTTKIYISSNNICVKQYMPSSLLTWDCTYFAHGTLFREKITAFAKWYLTYWYVTVCRGRVIELRKAYIASLNLLFTNYQQTLTMLKFIYRNSWLFAQVWWEKYELSQTKNDSIQNIFNFTVSSIKYRTVIIMFQILTLTGYLWYRETFIRV